MPGAGSRSKGPRAGPTSDVGKSLGGGAAAVAAVVVSKDIVERLKGTSWQNYGTLRGHPINSAAVSAYLKVVTDDKILEHVQKLEKLSSAVCSRSRGSIRASSAWRGRGCTGRSSCTDRTGVPWGSADTTEVPIASRVAERALEAGAAIGTSGEQISLFLAPPLVISEHEVGLLLDALDHGLDIADGGARGERGSRNARAVAGLAGGPPLASRDARGDALRCSGPCRRGTPIASATVFLRCQPQAMPSLRRRGSTLSPASCKAFAAWRAASAP
ncbi:MAG: aminotransferase class III-fold pyridoxal phosphate-dependent enzyme [Paludibaculum sp.]